MIYKYIDALISYGLDKGLIQQEDVIYTRNRLLEALRISAYETKGENRYSLSEILDKLTNYAIEKNISDTCNTQDLYDTMIMGLLTPQPSVVIGKFFDKYKNNPKEATDYFYKLCMDSNYIRKDRIILDKKWKTETSYGTLDITINLSKPEKDPRDIARAASVPKSGYPACLLCAENEGYAGNPNHPARQNLRIIPIEINNESWGLQYSPYVYYNEHCIVLNKKHMPMVIDRNVFVKLFSFVSQFPHYFVGSNADLPIVGGSILSHEHFQGGCYEFPMEKAETIRTFKISGYEDVEVGILKWPLSVIRITHCNSDKLVELADYILKKWRSYSDASVGIYAFTNETPHNTVTPIARIRNGKYELDLVLRNNITSEEHPFGVFHPHTELHNIKKENIGLIEVMGMAVLPSRLNTEMKLLKDALLENRDVNEIPEIAKHSEWVKSWINKYSISAETVETILENEIGFTFAQVLSHSGVFKGDETGQNAFNKFVQSLNN